MRINKYLALCGVASRRKSDDLIKAGKVSVLEMGKASTRLSVVINEGQNRQIRRMFEAIGKTITLLKRIAIGEITLGGLARGKYKPLNGIELDYFNRLMLGE